MKPAEQLIQLLRAAHRRPQPSPGARVLRPRRVFAALALVLACGACVDDPVTAPSADKAPPSTRSLVPGPSTALLSSIPLSTAFTYSTLPLHRANDVNDAEVVVGDIGGNNIAAYWTQASGLVVLGQVHSGSTACCSALVDLNESNVAVGTSTLGGGISLTQWTLGGVYTDLPTGMGRNFAQAINNLGEITAADDAGGGSPYYRSPTGTITGLSFAPSYFSGWSTDLNDAGVITGYLYVVPTGYHAVAWPSYAAPPVDLGTLGGNQSAAMALNDAGDIVGWSELTPGSTTRQATLWPASGGIVDLNSWPNPCPGASEAADVSDAGVIVGRCNGRPVLWTAVEGMRYLPLPSGMTTGDPRAINNDNVIVGMAPASFGGAIWRMANVAPVVTAIHLPSDPVPVGTSVAITASFDDANAGDTHTASVAWDDGSSTTGTVIESGGVGDVSASHTFTTPGVYTIEVTVDDGLASDTRSSSDDQPSYIVVYDPSAGFVTGGGWFNSPGSACQWSGCASDSSTTGKASFGFVSRYQNGASTPTGNTEFQFKAGGLSFRSTSYQWLVVAGARAQYKGEGQIDGGTGDYDFLVTAIDGSVSGGGGYDRFRIKIWERATSTIVYDNQMGEPDSSSAATAIAGGSIVIHK